VGWTGSEAIKDRLNGLLDGYPGILFVVRTGNVEIRKTKVSYTGN
jgi:hypothetical protein